MDYYGILNGIQGVEYYGQAHLTDWNSYAHTIGMPFTMYGMNIWIPKLLGLNYERATDMQAFFYIVYNVHYMTISFKIGLVAALVYAIPLVLANSQYRKVTFWHGFIVSFCALLFQEIVGHILSGDMNSRPEGVLNAILYAKYYSVYHLFQ